jgi:hypothetical protein
MQGAGKILQRSIWTICKQEIFPATQHLGWNVDFQAKKCPQPKGEARGKVSTELRHTLREEKRGMTRIIQALR